MELVGLKEKIEDFLGKNKRSLEYMESLFSIDDNRDREEEFYKEGKLKVLCLYLTAASSRAVSNTHNALVSLSKQLDPDNIVVDSCYFPEDGNLDIFKDNGIPYIFGSTCHEPIGFYDLVLMSNAVCPEVLNIPRFLSNSGVGLTIQQRDKQDIPLITFGGAAANETSIVLGPIYRDGKCIGKSLVDIGNYGYGEKSLATLAKTMLDWKNQGLNLHDKPMIKEKMISEGVLHDYLFFPEHYEWVYDENDHFTIKEIKCLDDRLPKQVKYGRIRLNEDMGWSVKCFNLSGDNADSHDIQISSGCSGGSSNCSFKRPIGTRLPLEGYGLVKIEDVVGLTGKTDKFLNEDYDAEVTDIVECGEEDIWKVRLSSGTEIKVSDQHLMQVQNYNTWDDITKKVNDVQVGDWMLLKLGTEYFGDYQDILGAKWDNSNERKPVCLGDLKCDEEVALLLGFIQGDGSVTLRECGNSTDRLQVFMKGKEVEVIHPILSRLFGEKDLRVQYTQKDGTDIMVYQRCGDSVKWLYESVGISSGKTNRVPDVIFRSPKSVIQAYLKGLFQADGWSTNSQLKVRRGQMGLTQISYEFLQDVQKLLLMCGIYAHVSERETVYIKDGYSNRQPAHYIMVSNEFVNKFKQEIGFIDKNMEEFEYRDWRCVPVPTFRNLIKYQRDKIPQDSIRRIDDQTHSGFISIKNLKLLLEWGLELPRIYKAIAEGNYYPVQVESVEKTSERIICYTTNVEPLHKICYDMVYEHNCMEATVAGGYREKKLDEVENLMKQTVRDCAPNTISFFSYNLNYYYRFMDLLATSAKYFSGVTLLNERLDVVAKSPDQLKLAKRMGLKRFSGAIEGFGPRIRDGLLNKNLNHETLMQANHVISSLGLMHFKAGLIATGQETDEDIDDFVKEIDEEIAIRDSYGANHSFQFNVTPLVFYSQIALRHFPRITAENSYNQVRNMGRFIEACQKRGIRSKFNGKGCGTWLEQMLLDFGPAGTDWMVGLVLDEDMGYVRFFGDKIKEASCRQLDKRGYTNHLFFTKSRPEDWIFPNDHIASIPEPLAKMWWQRTKRWYEGDSTAFDSQLCLKTPANPEGGKCYGCKMCETPEEIKDMTHREMYDEHSYEEVAEMLSESRLQKSVRVVVKMKPKWFFYNRTSLAHYITSRFLQANENIAEQFYSVGKTTTTWLSNNGQKGWYGGSWCFDINLRERVSVEEFNRCLDDINSNLESCQITSIIDDTKTMPVKRETKISYIGQTSEWALSQIKDKLSMFEWDIKIPVKSMGGQLDTEIKHLPELKDKVLFAQKGQSVIIGMDLPASISPYMVMSSILGKGYEKMLADFSFDIIDQTADTDMVDDKGHNIGYSYFTGQYNKESSINKVKKYLYALTH